VSEQISETSSSTKKTDMTRPRVTDGGNVVDADKRWPSSFRVRPWG